MLLRFSIQNFLSFNKQVCFDMFPNTKRTSFPGHIYSDQKIPLLKQAAIYGANGSGKTNLLMAIDYIKQFAINKEFHKVALWNDKAFRLTASYMAVPISFTIEFSHAEKYFIYEVEFIPNEILKEELYISGIGIEPNRRIFLRTKTVLFLDGILDPNIFNGFNKVLQSNPKSSVLSLNSEFPVLDGNVHMAFDWFDKCLKLKSLHDYNSSLISEMDQNPDLLRFANELINKIGLGVEGIGVNESNLADILSREDQKTMKDYIINYIKKEGKYIHRVNDKIIFCIEEKDEEHILKQFEFRQQGENGYVGIMGFDSQSDGTSKILNLIPVLYDLIHNESIYFIDEIENSIHPSLIIALMKFYSQTKTKGQLIYTTHETELLNQQELMRPDEVWFTEKQDGQTKLYSLNDFKEHNTINIKNGYLDGRYGAIPFIGNLNENNCD